MTTSAGRVDINQLRSPRGGHGTRTRRSSRHPHKKTRQNYTAKRLFQEIQNKSNSDSMKLATPYGINISNSPGLILDKIMDCFQPLQAATIRKVGSLMGSLMGSLLATGVSFGICTRSAEAWFATREVPPEQIHEPTGAGQIFRTQRPRGPGTRERTSTPATEQDPARFVQGFESICAGAPSPGRN